MLSSVLMPFKKGLTSVMVVCAELSRECEATYNMGSGGGGERATVPYTSLLKYLLAPDGIWVKKSHRLQFYIH